MAREQWGSKSKLKYLRALDIGSGSGSDTAQLLRAGFQVTVVDSSRLSFKFLRRRLMKAKLRLPQLVLSKIETFTRKKGPKFDLVNASYVLPFIPPKKFSSEIKKITKLTKPGGIFAFNLFGQRDSWNKEYKEMTFVNRSQIRKLLPDFKIISLKEWEEDGKSALGEPKHWHTFGIVAVKKPLKKPPSSQ